MKHDKLFALLAAFAAACGPGARHGAGDDDGVDGGGGGGDDGGSTGNSCSSDLHNVVDSSGNVVMTCPNDQGCENGMCVPACQAAAASQGSVGCDFVVATPSFYPGIAPPCFAVFLANNWPLDSQVTLARGGINYDPTTFGRVPNGTNEATGWPAVASTGIASSNVGVFFLSTDPSAMNGDIAMTCPIGAAIDTTDGAAVYTGAASASGLGTAFHITTSVPVSAYDIMPYGGADSFLPSAELVLPTSAWGTNYVAAMPNPTTSDSQQSGPGFGQIVAATDNTTVMITPTHALPAGTGVAAAPANTSTTYTLNAGQFVQWQDSGDMAGSVITSSNPVSYTGGTGYLCRTSATSSDGGCDSGHQQTPPVSALGSVYVAPPYATRRSDLQPESIPYRLVGTVAGTTLTYSPAVSGAPPTLGVGQVAEFESTVPFIVQSQDAMHPFYVGQYMTGCMVTSGSRPGDDGQGCLGDEEFVNIVPPAQWLSSYVFFTDPTYTTTNLVVVRKADSAGAFQDVTIDCLGTLTGWQNVSDGTQYQITNADLQRDTPVGSCTNGRHTATSTGAFTLMVWGLANAASYGYPAGGNVGKINSVIVIQ